MPIKVGDIVEIDIEMEIMASPEELESKKELDTNKYKRKYRVEYSINDTKFQSESVLEAEPNMVPPEDNIRTFIKEELKNEFPEVTGYEILDIDEDYLHQSATIKITAVKD